MNRIIICVFFCGHFLFTDKLIIVLHESTKVNLVETKCNLIRASCGERAALEAGEHDPIIGALLIIMVRGDLVGVVGSCSSSL